MGLFDFIKGIGKKNEAKPEQAPVNPTEPTAQEIANQLLAHIQALGIQVESLSVSYNNVTDTAVIKGQVHSQADKEKIVLAAGNVDHVAQVDDQLILSEQAEPQPQSQFYTVKSGDTLSKISSEVYGDANQYNKIFEANKPLLKDANSIYPGQVLRIPA